MRVRVSKQPSPQSSPRWHYIGSNMHERADSTHEIVLTTKFKVSHHQTTKFKVYQIKYTHYPLLFTGVWCLLKGWKGLGAESEPQTDLRFLVEKFCGTRWTAFHWQLDRSQRNLDLGATDISEDWNPASQDCCATISVLLNFFELILLCLCLIFSSLPILWAVSKVVLVLVLETK